MAELRDSEQTTADLLVKFLKNRGLAVKGSRGDDPPDLVLSVNGERWAVEVTEIPLRVNDLGSDGSIHHFKAWIDRLVEKVNSQITLPPGIDYTIWAESPFSRKSKDMRRLERGAVEFIEQAELGKRDLDEHGLIFIQATSGEGSLSHKVHRALTMGSHAHVGIEQKDASDLNAQLSHVLAHALEEKQDVSKRLRAERRAPFARVVLALWNRDFRFDESMWISKILEADNIARGSWDLIVLVQNGIVQPVFDPSRVLQDHGGQEPA